MLTISSLVFSKLCAVAVVYTIFIGGRSWGQWVGVDNNAGSKSQSSSRSSAEHTESRREILHSGGRLTPSWPVGGLLSPRTPYRGALIPDALGMSAPHEALGPVSEAAGAVTENPARLRPDLADPALARSLTLFTMTLTDSGRSSTNMGHSASVAGLG